MGQRKLYAIERKLARADQVRMAADEEKGTRLLRGNEMLGPRTVSCSPLRAASPTTSPSPPWRRDAAGTKMGRSSLLLGSGSPEPRRCAPPLGSHAALRPDSQRALRPSQSEPRHLRPPSSAELPNLLGSPIGHLDLGRFDDWGFDGGAKVEGEQSFRQNSQTA